MAQGNELKKILAFLTTGGTRGSEPGSGLLAALASSSETRAGKITNEARERPAWTWVASPVVTGIMSLFRKKRNAAPASAGGAVAAPQRLERMVSQAENWEAMSMDRGGGGEARRMEPNGGQRVQVVIQAMDSRSFLDRQDEIAAALRRAVMESAGSGEIDEER